MYIARSIATGELVGQPIPPGARFQIPGTSLHCETAPADGLVLHDADGVEILRLYEIEDIVEGEGGSVVTGDPVYDSGADRVQRTIVRSKTLREQALEDMAWVRQRTEAYKETVLEMKSVPPMIGTEIMGLGFVIDCLTTELLAIRQGAPMTAEFTDLIARIAAVKEAIPRPD